MKQTELRIGNLVMVKSSARHADGLTEKNTFFKISTLTEVSVLFKGFGTSEYYADLKPIPLTESWLRDFGFDDEEYMQGWIGLNVTTENGWHTDFPLAKPHSKHNDTDCFAFEYMVGKVPFTNTFKYVHHLQNFFYAITNQELKLRK